TRFSRDWSSDVALPISTSYPEASRLPDAGLPREGTKEAWPARGPQEVPVLQALIARLPELLTTRPPPGGPRRSFRPLPPLPASRSEERRVGKECTARGS